MHWFIVRGPDLVLKRDADLFVSQDPACVKLNSKGEQQMSGSTDRDPVPSEASTSVSAQICQPVCTDCCLRKNVQQVDGSAFLPQAVKRKEVDYLQRGHRGHTVQLPHLNWTQL